MKIFISKVNGKIFYGWVVLIDLLIFLALVLGIRYSFGVFFKSIEADFNLTRAATSAIYSVYMVLCCIFAIIGGWGLDRYGPRMVVAAMGLFTLLSLILTSQAHSLWQLFITYSFFLSIGTGPGFALMMATASRWFVKKRGLAMGIATSGEGLGMIAVSPFSVFLISRFGWRISYLVLGLVTGLLMIFLALFLRKDPNEIGLLPDGLIPAEIPVYHKKDHFTAISFSVWEAFRTRSFWLLWIIWLLFGLCLHLVLTHIVAHITDVGVSAFHAGTILALIGGIGILGRLVVGGVSDRIGRKRSAVLCALLTALGMIWLAGSKSLWMFYLFSVYYGFFLGGLSTLLAALISDIFGLNSLGSIAGALVVGFNIGGAVGPLIAGFIFDVSRDYLMAFLAAAAALFTSALCLTLVRKETKGKGVSHAPEVNII